MTKEYRFTDWYNELNDSYGTWKECKRRFDAAVKADPQGRFSIYDVTGDNDFGVLWNEKCPDYE